MQLHVLSAGAAQGLVTGLAVAFRAETGLEVAATFGAVGAMKERLLAGAPADLVVLSQAMALDLQRTGHLAESSDIDIGAVHTGLAIRAADPVPPLHDAAAVRDALRHADAIYVPDPATATAGIHLTRVMRQLGVAAELAPRIRPFPNGNAAMAALAAHAGGPAIGCTQVTEIIATPGVTLAALLPHELELATVYTASVTRRATHPDAARRLAEMLAGDAAEALRERLGFAPAHH
jgi:molybdate transport system substrate-binding protein